jgi:hypothetical protein
MARRVLFLALAVLLAGYTLAGDASQKPPQWSFNATIIEACSCPMFCQCYFATSPAGHPGHEGHGSEHYCRFNMGYKVNRGSYGPTKLDGARFWVSGDLGDDFGGGHTDWAVVTFDKAVSKEQRGGIAAILGYIYPVKWNSLTTSEGEVSWVANKDEAHALLDGGKSGEVSLKRNPGMTNDPVVIKNLRYFGAARNEGFVLMPSVVEAYRVGEKAFEFKGTNGFMITLDMNSGDVPAQTTGTR